MIGVCRAVIGVVVYIYFSQSLPKEERREVNTKLRTGTPSTFRVAPMNLAFLPDAKFRTRGAENDERKRNEPHRKSPHLRLILSYIYLLSSY